eukprot:TRINITY_DN1358_c0_g3_i1.p1 TRINITY_DN1358_c0_g3~~TRINITY_DN1358_c0_g3_i1.p1  ORF type:complete len:432 (+),score=130.33 TRINITY_DN1358_c0_g3_i1:23-1297(+)
MAKKKERGKEGNAVKYTTRNQALKRLQIKLPEFRRLCILKGIHPREPKKKVQGQHKTYYHVKDINFLAHEPLLEKGRELKVHMRKLKKARAKLDEQLLERLQKNKPSYSLDHLVKERYPSFIDALRDLDDALTLLHLFAVLPADTTHKIPAERVQIARRLSLEWQAYVTRTHSLRRTFVSVKGIYYQAEVVGQKVTWLVPHQLSQVIPADVDFRVMLTFLEFYETLTEFINFKLYHDLGLPYPPLLDPRLDAAAADLFAMIRDLASKAGRRAEKAAPSDEAEGKVPEGTAPTDAHVPSESNFPGDGEKKDQGQDMPDPASDGRVRQKLLEAESAARLASLTSRLAAMAQKSEQPGDGSEDANMESNEAGKRSDVEGVGEGEEEEEGTVRRQFRKHLRSRDPVLLSFCPQHLNFGISTPPSPPLP